MRIGIEPRQHRQERVVAALREPLQGREPHCRQRIAEEIDEGVHADVRGGIPQREQRLGARRGMKAARIEKFRQHRLRVGVSDASQRSNRLDGDRARRARRLDQRQQHRNRRGVAQRAEALDGKCPGVCRLYGGEDQQCRQRPLVFDALQRIGDRPPLHARLPIGRKHRRRKCVEVLQPCQRVHAQPECVCRRIDLGPSIVRRDGCRRRGVRRHHLSDRGRRSGVVQQPKRLGRTSSHQRHRIGHRGPQRLDGRWIADQTERERRHLPHFGIGVCLQQAHERRDALRQSHAADRDRRSAANACLGVVEQPNQIRRRRRSRKNRALVLRNRRRRDRHGRIAEHPLIFQAEHPRHLRLERHNRWRRQRDTPARGGEHEQQDE